MITHNVYFPIRTTLLKLKFNVSSIGFNYWITSIIEYRRNYFRYNNTIENIYEEIALLHNSTRNRVERAMRTALAPAKEEIRKKFNYNGRITNKVALELLSNNYMFLFNENHIPRID